MNKDNVKLAIAPIGWTNDDMPELGSENTFQQIVSEMALAGFTGSEVGSKYPRDPAVLKPMLDIRGIQICNAWFSTFFANGQREKTIDEFVNHMNFLHAMGAKVIGCSEQSGSIQGWKSPSWRMRNRALAKKSGSGWRKAITPSVVWRRKRACRFVCTTIWAPVSRRRQRFDKFMSLVDDKVFLLYDTGHAWYSEGGEEPMLAILKKYLPRINHVHLKDVRPPVIEQVRREGLSFLDGVKKGTFTVPGDGVIDFRPVFKLLDEHGYKGWMVVEAEQDPALANPFEYAVKARKYIRETAGI